MADHSGDSRALCLFCRIIDGEIPATRIAESGEALAFRDINPQGPTHVVVIPKRHVATVVGLAAASAQELQALFALAGQVAVDEGLDAGYRMVTNTGGHAGQTVFHAHVHLIGGRPLGWPPG